MCILFHISIIVNAVFVLSNKSRGQILDPNPLFVSFDFLLKCIWFGFSYLERGNEPPKRGILDELIFPHRLASDAVSTITGQNKVTSFPLICIELRSEWLFFPCIAHHTNSYWLSISWLCFMKKYWTRYCHAVFFSSTERNVLNDVSLEQ